MTVVAYMFIKMIESDASEENYEEIKSKSRRSLFLPSDVTVSEPTKTKTSDEEYVNKLKLEEDTWKQMYAEQKEQKKKLLNKLKMNSPQIIDFSLFDEEETKYINSGPDIALFVREGEDLKKLVKIVNLQCEHKRQKCALMLEKIENACSSVKSILNS